MTLFTADDRQIISNNLDKMPKHIMPLLSKQYTSEQISKCKWHIRHREHALATAANWRAANVEYCAEINARYRMVNADKIKKKQAAYRKDNADKERQRKREYRQELKERYNIPDRFGGQQQRYVQGLIEEALDTKALAEHRFHWLRSRKDYVMAVDAYFPKHKLIVEYNGPQHYKPVIFGGTYTQALCKFISQVIRDKHKYAQIRARGYRLLIVHYSWGKQRILRKLEEVMLRDKCRIENTAS